MEVTLNLNSVNDYKKFLAIKSLPRYSVRGRTMIFPDEYANRIGITLPRQEHSAYIPQAKLFDYQRDISGLAIERRKFAAFIEPGYGKTFIDGEFIRHCRQILPAGKCCLIVAPLMVVPQMIEEFDWFYNGDLPVERVRASELAEWLKNGTGRLGITNYDALKEDTPEGRLGCLVLSESSMLKSQYGKHGQVAIRLGKGLDWKLAETGTPAPNDRIEFANHAVFLDEVPNVNSFLAKYFVNKGQTDGRWEMKAHALQPFYRSLSHWSIFMTNPATYGWKDNAGTLPPIHIHYHEVPLTEEQTNLVQMETGSLFGSNPGGILGRSVLGQIAKGNFRGKSISTNKNKYIEGLVDSWKGESTIIWCIYNAEQEAIAKMFPMAANIDGKTPDSKRLERIHAFRKGEIPILISKAEILGFGLNLQKATRQVFSGIADSYEDFYQCIKRSNRVGSTMDLNVHIPLTSIERPMVDNVLRKAKRVESDAREQEEVFAKFALPGLKRIEAA